MFSDSSSNNDDKDEEGDESAGDFQQDLLKDENNDTTRRDGDESKREIVDDEDGDVVGGGSEDNYGDPEQCPTPNFHHTLIPQRSRGFHFHKFHGHSHSLGDCAKRCCRKEDCILGFQLESTCLGILCSDDDRSCHSKKDFLDVLKIQFSLLKGLSFFFFYSYTCFFL